jgi:hypothetical protein
MAASSGFMIVPNSRISRIPRGATSATARCNHRIGGVVSGYQFCFVTVGIGWLPVDTTWRPYSLLIEAFRKAT